jgi:hypothetical protein
MTISVFGFRSGGFDDERLQAAVRQNNRSFLSQGRTRTMRGFSVDAQGAAVLEERFGEGFLSFVLLDDVSVVACRSLGIDIGSYLGAIDVNEIQGSAKQLFVLDYLSEEVGVP